MFIHFFDKFSLLVEIFFKFFFCLLALYAIDRFVCQKASKRGRQECKGQFWTYLQLTRNLLALYFVALRDFFSIENIPIPTIIKGLEVAVAWSCATSLTHIALPKSHAPSGCTYSKYPTTQWPEWPSPCAMPTPTCGHLHPLIPIVPSSRMHSIPCLTQ